MPPAPSGRKFAVPIGGDVQQEVAPAPDVASRTEPEMTGTNNAESRSRLTLFGGPTLSRHDGAEVGLTPSHRRLLALVWGHGARGVARSTAIWLLWEQEDEAKSRHRLRQLLHDLANRVGFKPVSGEGGELLVPATTWVASDLEDFAEAQSARRLLEALRIERGTFGVLLEGRSAGGEEFQDWLLAKREAYRRQLRETAAAQWDRFRPVAAWEPALEAAEVLSALDPENDAVLAKLVEARAMSGQVERAEAAVEDFLERVPEGSRAATGALHLLDKIRRMQPVTSFQPSKTSQQPPLVGRRPALATARTTLARVRDGSFEFVLITGEAGAGKTRLMEEVWREAGLAGFRCLEARPSEVERRIPLNPLVDMMADPFMLRHVRNLEEPWRSVVATLLPTLPEGMDPPVVPPIQDASLSRRLLDSIATLLTSMAEEEPVVLFIDDLQWADATTIAVLQFVQRRWTSGSLGVVATLRPDLVRSGDPVAKYLGDSADLPVTRVTLEELTEVEARTLVELVAGKEKELDPAEVTRLCALGGRNPFYLTELTRDYLAGKVHLPELPTDAITLPISLRQLLDPRIQSLGPETAGVASYLAVWGRELGLPDLARLIGAGLKEAAIHTERLERARLAVVERGKVRLTHELFRSAIYHGLSASRRAVLHGEIATFVEEWDGALVGEAAIHHDRAGNAAGAAKRAREAADKVLESGAVAEAAYYLQLVLDNETDAVLKAEATADLARVLHMNREILRANPLLELAASRLRAVGNHARALRMDVRRVEGLAEVGAAPLSELLDRLATIKASARADGDDEALALALDSELHLLHRSGEVDAIRALFQEVREVASSADPAAACLANASLALNVLFGDGEEALQCAREAVRLAEGGEHLLRAMSRMIMVLVTRTELGQAVYTPLLRRAQQVSERSGDLALRFQVLSNQAVYFIDVGAYEEARELLARAGAILKGAEASVLRISHYCNLGELALLTDNPSEAVGWFREAERLYGPTMPAFYNSLVEAGLGLAALEAGAVAEARIREANLAELPKSLYFDPLLVVLFRSRMHERRGDLLQALNVLDACRPELRKRFPGAWMRMEVHRGVVARKARAPHHDGLLEAIQLARGLSLTNLAVQLERAAEARSR